MRRTVLIVFVLFAATLQAQEFIPISVWYGGGKARAPMIEIDPAAHRDAWRADLKQIRALGFNTVRCWVDWATVEPVEGKYDFTALDQLADLAQEQGLRLIVQVYVDSAPDWVGKRYPDSHYVSISGDVMPSNAAPGYCFDHPGVRKAVLGLFSALATEMKSHPAFLAWDLWSEPHVINWAEATYLVSPEFCFCPYSVGRFRSWLQTKYGSLDALNRAWYRRFEKWDDVEPNRLSTILSYSDFIDWRFFIIDKLAEDLRMRQEAVKRVLPDKLATSHAAAPSLFTSPLSGDGTPDDWKMAKIVDYWGTSFYPKHSYPVGRDAGWRAALLDFARSSGGERGFWVGELQAGFGTIALRVSSTVTPADLRMWMWSALARGAKGVNVYAWYPMSSGYESGGFGLINLDGTITERARAAGAVAKTVDANQRLFANARPVPAEVAIVYNPLSYMVGGRRPQWASAGQGEVANIERNSLLGLYRALFPASIPVDFIHIDELAQGKAGRYKLLFVPYPLMISEAAGRAMREYVQNGGTLVSEARLGWNDEHGWAKEIIPGFGLHEVAGCREAAIQQTPTGKTELQFTSDFAGLKAGETIHGFVYEETLQPLGERARVIARFRDGSPAIVASEFGKGRMLTVGTFLGTAFETDREESLGRFLRGVVQWAEVVSPVASSESSVEARLLRSGNETLVFAFNHGAAPVAPTIAVRGAGKVREITGGAAAVPAECPAGNVCMQPPLPAGGVWVGVIR